MRSQAWYNTNTQVFLTQLLMYLYDNKETTYESYTDAMDISPQTFSKYIKIFKNMVKDLHMNASLVIDKYLDKTTDTNQFKTKVYILQTYSEDKYYFDYNNLSEEKLITYSMTIVYLMLKQHQFVKFEKLVKIFPNFRREILINLIDKLQDLSLDEITKNELKSYVMITED